MPEILTDEQAWGSAPQEQRPATRLLTDEEAWEEPAQTIAKKEEATKSLSGAFFEGMFDNIEGTFASPLGIEAGGETEKALQQAGIFNDYAKGENDYFKSFNEAVIRPAAVAADTALRLGVVPFTAVGEALGAVSDTAENKIVKFATGAPAEILSSVPEGSLMGMHAMDTVSALRARDIALEVRTKKATLPPEVAQARALGIIGEGEEGFKGTVVPTPENLAARMEAAAQVPEVKPLNIHAVAREISPDVFSVYDRLSMIKDDLRRQLMEATEAKTADLDAQISAIQEAKKGGHGKLQKLIAQRDEIAATGDTPEMAALREKIQKTDYDMRDLAPQVSDAYRKAQERMPKDIIEPVKDVQKPVAEPVPSEIVEPVQSIEEQRAFIASDLKERAVAAGEKPEVADAVAQLEAARYETLAKLYGDKRGTALDWYNKESADIKEGSKPKVLALAQSKELYQRYIKETATKIDDVLKAASLEGNKNKVATIGRASPWLTEKAKEAGLDIAGYDHAVDMSAVRHVRNNHGNAKIEKQRGQIAVSDEDLRRIPELLANPDKVVFGTKTNIGRDAITYIKTMHDGSTLYLEEVRTGRRQLSAVSMRKFPATTNATSLLKSLRLTSKTLREATTTIHEVPKNTSAVEIIGKAQELDQHNRGKIRLATENAKATITLFRDKNASTLIHEKGHEWTDQVLRLATEENAPAQMKADAATIRKYVGANEGEALTRVQHEKLARGFERYLMEGIAPSKALAGVFQRFKQWLTNIYHTVERLRSPINDDIRDVFDRFFTENPEKIVENTVIASEPHSVKMLADIHEIDAKQATPQQAPEIAENMRGEINRAAKEHDREAYHDIRSAERIEDRPSESGSTGENGNDAGQGAPVKVDGVGNKTKGESASVRAIPATEPHNSFARDSGQYIDKAGNIRLENLTGNEDVRSAIRQAAESSNDFSAVRRGVVSDRDISDMADALGISDRELSLEKLKLVADRNDVPLAVHIKVGRQMLVQSAEAAHQAMLKAASGMPDDLLALAEARNRHLMIAETVASITEEWGRAGRAFRDISKEQMKSVEAFTDLFQRMTGQSPDQMRELAKRGALLDTPAKVAKFLQDSKKPTFGDKIIEYWINALLSGPKTHVVNIVGNFLTAFNSVVETGVAAGIGKVRQALGDAGEAVQLSEMKGRLYGLLAGSREGLSVAKECFKREEYSQEGHTLEANRQAIPGTLGKVIRTPTRFLSAEDELFKAIGYRQELNALAYRQASSEGLAGTAFAARVADITRNPTEAMIDAASKNADYQTFTTPLGKTGRAIQNFANSHPLAKFVIPFIRTPTNLLKYAGERTPVGLFSATVRDSLLGKNGPIARDTQLARMAVGTSIGLAAMSLAMDGAVTGGGPSDKRQRATLRLTGWQPYSVRIGETYYSYASFEPFSTIIGMTADVIDIAKYGDMKDDEAAKVAAGVFASTVKNLMSKLSLRGVSDFIQSATDPDRYGKQYVSGFASSFVPALVGQMAQSSDPVQRQTQTAIAEIQSRIPFLREDLLPKRNVWGEPIVSQGSLGPDFLTRVYESAVNKDPVNQRLLALGINPSMPDRKIRGVELTEQQYDDYCKISGRMMKERLDQLVGMKQFASTPEAAQVKAITKIIENSRETARSVLMMRNPDLLKKAISLKLQKNTGKTKN